MTGDYEVLLATLRGRRSVRRFLPDPVPEEGIEALVEAARWAPSASNRQAYRLLLVTNPELRAALAAAVEAAARMLCAELREDMRPWGGHYAAHFTHFAEAPLLVVPIHRAGGDLLRAAGAARGGERGEADALQSVAAAIQNLLLAAHTLGLGACWMTGPLVAEPALSRLLAVPRGWRISALIPVGVPAERPPAPPRRAAARLVRRVEGAAS